MLRILSAILGGAVTYVLLIVLAGTAESQNFLIAVVVGVAIAIGFPWLIDLMVGRRVRDQRRAEIDREVQDRLAQKSREG
ncbi:MAG: hypothetical protein ABJC39_10125 [Chloroflexota bacterium]